MCQYELSIYDKNKIVAVLIISCCWKLGLQRFEYLFFL